MQDESPFSMKYIRSQYLFFILITFLSIQESFAQIPQVPAELEFADLIVRINPQARREIQLDVDALYRNPSYFAVKRDRVNLYMPTIERVLQEVGVPLDLKYLVIQESGLIADAVSTSNAVGFWQFKKGTAEEVFLRVDNHIDERKNIVSSTRGAALYLKKHNNTFDNWMCALVSYQMGLGGAKAYFGNKHNGKRVVDIDRNSHWYFKKYLAHKVAFENQIGTFVSNTNQHLVVVDVQGPTTLAALAKKYGVTKEHLEEYNKWTSNGKIPAGKNYALVYVNEGKIKVQTAEIQEPEAPITQQIVTTSTNPLVKQADAFPKVAGNTARSNQPNQITINDIEGIQASKTTTIDALSEQVGIRKNKLRRLNDLDKGETIEKGEYYYTEKKSSTAMVATHVVRPGESLWSISQKYGIRLSSLKAKNRIRNDRDLKAGMVLNLQEHRERGSEIPIVKLEPTTETRIVKVNATPANVPPARSTTTPTQNNTNAQQTHIVKQGETLFAISKMYGITVPQLKTWNNIGSDNIISIGQKLVIFKP